MIEIFISQIWKIILWIEFTNFFFKFGNFYIYAYLKLVTLANTFDTCAYNSDCIWPSVLAPEFCILQSSYSTINNSNNNVKFTNNKSHMQQPLYKHFCVRNQKVVFLFCWVQSIHKWFGNFFNQTWIRNLLGHTVQSSLKNVKEYISWNYCLPLESESRTEQYVLQGD